MNIECKLGSIEFFSDDDVEKMFRECSTSVDDIWIYGDSQYPCLAIPIHREKAVVHYFASEEGSHYQAIGIRIVQHRFMYKNAHPVLNGIKYKKQK